MLLILFMRRPLYLPKNKTLKVFLSCSLYSGSSCWIYFSLNIWRKGLENSEQFFQTNRNIFPIKKKKKKKAGRDKGRGGGKEGGKERERESQRQRKRELPSCFTTQLNKIIEREKKAKPIKEMEQNRNKRL